MKVSKENLKIQEFLKSGKVALGGFLGSDNRNFIEIIESDQNELARINLESKKLTDAMLKITQKTMNFIGNWVKISDNLEAKTEEVKGSIICPFPHNTKPFLKWFTTLRDLRTGEEFKWSELSIHLIEEHSFFQGKGSEFRIEPAKFAKVLNLIEEK
ncbi:MAG TPA: hypothetical protein P5270_05645 [Victivallales bacterium]|nr:hypothetical protein [Victivallales bacterium]HRR28828.1 hypothetical protein [Victivallales bacterium]HRU00197.1 hypothetical protein [Victivallales bacterium]